MVQKNTGSESCGGVQINHTWPVAYFSYGAETASKITFSPVSDSAKCPLRP